MTITKRRGAWFGTEGGDLDEYLSAFAAGGYSVDTVSHAACGSCAGRTFRVLLDDEEGASVRVCSACSAQHAMLDCASYLADATLGAAACPCGGEQFDVAVGYSLLDDGDVRWVSVALRCQTDGLLGVYADWKIDYTPSGHLVTLA
ncbi:hypothetical protein [Cellulomonas sp. URHD0024]|uniref:hypothetical protein n=1 Tax=Cellulomonas sp. URHD0024 TaxID=1302620 RepID=UPI0003FE461A|nr:hypothetical protein [Cellulomonas sp. URHD0024]